MVRRCSCIGKERGGESIQWRHPSCVCRLEAAKRAAADAREKLERQNQQLSDLEAEVGLLRRRVEQLETDRDKDKKLIAQLQESLNRARAVCSLCHAVIHAPDGHFLRSPRLAAI